MSSQNLCFGGLWAPFGTLSDASGSQGALLGITLSSFWLPWDAGGPLWGTLGSQVELGMTLDVLFRQYLERLRCLRIKSDLALFSRGSALSRQSGARAAAPNPNSIAPGARMTVVKHTPSKNNILASPLPIILPWGLRPVAGPRGRQPNRNGHPPPRRPGGDQLGWEHTQY